MTRNVSVPFLALPSGSIMGADERASDRGATADALICGATRPQFNSSSAPPRYQAGRPGFKHGCIAQALIDIGAVLFGLFCIACWVASVGFSVSLLVIIAVS